VVDAIGEEEPREPGRLRHHVRLGEQHRVAKARQRLRAVLEQPRRHGDLVVATVAIDAAQLVAAVDMPGRQPGVTVHARAVEPEVLDDGLLVCRAGGERHRDRDRDRYSLVHQNADFSAWHSAHFAAGRASSTSARWHAALRPQDWCWRSRELSMIALVWRSRSVW